MANKKVSQLTSKPSVLTTDLFPIADPSTGQLFKTTISDLGTAIGSGVSSVNSLVGAVVLDTDDIQELVSPTNKWFTDTRARAALSASSPLTYNSGTGAFGIQVANGSQNGYLSSADWNTFNNKMPAITFNSPLFIASGGDVSITLATTSANGYLSSTDWNTFNNKVGGSGTNTYLAMFSASKTLTSSAISYDGTKTTVEAQGLVSLNGLELQGAYNSVSGLKLLSNDSTTGYSYMEFTNTGGGFRLGVNRNTAGGILSGSATYATFLTTTGATSLQLGANGALILSLNTSGLARFYNQVQIDNTVTATQFIRTGGTSSQFLKADGSVDSSTYLTTGTASSTYLPLSGGTLTGALSGTSATFSGALTGSNGVFKNPGASPNNTLFIQTSDYASGSAGSVLRLGHVATTGNTTAIIQNLTNGGTAAGNISFPEGNVGIGTTSPGAKLDIAGGDLYVRTGGALYANTLAPYSGNMTISLGGSGNNLIVSGGNVGIGTTSPGYKLEVVGAGGTNQPARFESATTLLYTAYRANGTDVGYIGNGSGVAVSGSTTDFGINASNNLVFTTTGATERMRITSAGNVGIGTSSTTSRLTIGVGTGEMEGLTLKDGSVNATSVFTYSSLSGENRIGGVVSYAFPTFYSGGSERMRITSGGNVGIGTTSPTSLLDVKGSASIISLNNTSTGSFSSVVYKYADSYLGEIGATAGSGQMQINMGPSAGWGGFITFKTDTSERMRITSGGNVGIGLTNPQTQFHINGVMTFSEAGFDTVRLHKIVHGHSDGNSANNYIAFQVSDGSGTTAERFRTDGNGNLIHKSYSVGQGILWSYSGGATYGFYNANNGTFVLTNSGVANVGSFNMSSGAYTALSDANKKKDFEVSNYGLAEVMQLKPTLFRYKTDSSNAKKDLGFIAQEVKDIIPQAYVESDGFIGLNDRPLIATLTKAIQELKAELDSLKNK